MSKRPNHSKKRKPNVTREQSAFYEAMPSTAQFGAATDRLLPSLDETIAAGKRARSGAKRAYSASKPTLALGGAALRDVLAVCGMLVRVTVSRRAILTYAILFGISAIIGSIVLVEAAGATFSRYAQDLKSPAALMAVKKTGITILDRNGVPLYSGYGATSQTSVPLSGVTNDLKEATLAAEDPSFYNHSAVSWLGTARAAWVDVTSGSKAEGGSTLTQQLVKNALLTSTKSYVRKFQEIVLATDLQQRYSKDQILDMYLNDVYYGQGSNGVEAAAQSYFNTSANKLTLAQSAFIAGLPLGPSRFDPNLDPSAALGRRNYVLGRMAQLGYITAAAAKTAEAQPLDAGARQVTIRAPHFVFYVLNELRQTYGDDVVENGGITVKTTLDITKQDQAQAIVTQQVAKLAGHNATNGGLISMVPATGDIIAMVGSIGYDTPGFGAVNVTTSLLQPGSSFKPIAYVAAFMKGWNGSTQVQDTPISIPNGDGTYYQPTDYDMKYRGTVTLRQALSNSLNIPAVRVLQFVGIPDTLTMAQKLGVTTLGTDASKYGLSLVLGAGEVTAVDMATVYSTFANGGIKVEPRSILAVTDRNGISIMKDTQPAPVREIPDQYAAMITSILSDNRARTPEFGANSPLLLDRPSAAKTGTTNDFRDNWTVGYTPDLTTAVWVGNNDHSAMEDIDGITGAAPIWHDYMEAALAGTPVHDFTLPASVISQHVCNDGGLAPDSVSGYDEVTPVDAPLTRSCGLDDMPTPSPVSTPLSSPTPTQTPVASPIGIIIRHRIDKLKNDITSL